MNAAFGYRDLIGWRSTCRNFLDVAVEMRCKEEIRRFVSRRDLAEELGEKDAPVDCLEELFEKHPAIFHSRRITTGRRSLL